MDKLTSRFQSKTFRRAKGIDDYKLYQAALEWDLIDPIVIEKREDIKSEYWQVPQNSDTFSTGLNINNVNV